MLKTPTFEELLTHARQSADADFFALRMALATSPRYAPYGDTAALVKRADETMAAKRWDAAAAAVDALLDAQPLDIDAHMRAEYVHQQRGDAARQQAHFRFADGLLRSIVTRGDGRSFETAWVVIATDEEYAVMRALGLMPAGQRLEHALDRAYDVHTVVRAHDRSPAGTMYFNVDIPMAALARKLPAR